MTAAELETTFSARGQLRGGVLFLPVDVAIEMVQSARRAGLRVLGADAFILSPVTTQPVLEHSIDLSGETGDAWTIMESFLASHVGSQYHFEIVAADS